VHEVQPAQAPAPEGAFSTSSHNGIRRTSATLWLRSWSRPLFLGILAAAVVSFVGYRLVHDARALSGQDLRFSLAPAVAALPFLTAGVLLTGLAWIVLLRKSAGGQHRRDTSQLMRVFLFAWMGRYVPGKLPFFLGKVYLAQSLNYPLSSLVVATVIESVLQLLAATAFGAVMILVALGMTADKGYAWLALLTLPSVALLHPRVLAPAANRMLRLLKKNELPMTSFPDFRTTLLAAALYLLAFASNGFGFHLITLSTVDISWSRIPLSMGVFALSGVVGILVVFAPAGLGAREGTIAGTLAPVIGVHHAAVVALFSRVWLTAVDLMLVGGALLVDYVSGDRLLSKVIAGRRHHSTAGESQPPRLENARARPVVPTEAGSFE